MNSQPFFESSIVIQLHVYAALAALLLGTYVMFRRKGTSAHKLAGRIWAVLIALVAISSFAINEIEIWGPFSPIHLLSIIVLVSLTHAIVSVRQGKVDKHESTMKWLFFGGLVLPGLFTLFPGRLLFEVALEPTLEVWFAGTTPPDEVNPIFASFAAAIIGLLIVVLSNRLRRQ